MARICSGVGWLARRRMMSCSSRKLADRCWFPTPVNQALAPAGVGIETAEAVGQGYQGCQW